MTAEPVTPGPPDSREGPPLLFAAERAEGLETLRLLSLGLTVGAALLLILELASGDLWLLPPLLFLGAGLSGLIARRADRPESGGYLLVGLVLAGFLSVLLPAFLPIGLTGTAALSALVWFGVLLLAAGLLLGWWGALAATAVGLVALAATFLLGDRIAGAPVAVVDVLLVVVEIAVLAYALNLAIRAGARARERAREIQQALEQTRFTLQGQIEERTQALSLAATVGRQITRIQDLDTLLHESVELIRERFGLYHVQVYLVSPATQELVLRAGTGDAGAELLRRHHRLPLGPGSINGAAAAGREPVVVPYARQSAVFLPNPLLPETQAELALPMIVEDDVIGTLNLQSNVPGGLGPDSVPAFTVLAAQLATAVENARLFTEITETREQLARQAAALTRDGWRDYLEDQPSDLVLGTPDEQNGEHLRQPITVRGATIGYMELGPPATDARRVQELTAAVAGQLGAHLENLRLTRQAETALREARRREEELALVNRVVTAIASSSDLGSSLQLIVDQLAMATSIQQVGIAILNRERTGLTVVADRSGRLNTESAVGFVIPLENNPATQLAISERRPVVVPNATENPLTASAHEVLRQRGVKTILILPLVVENEVIGTVGLDVVEEGIELTEDQLRLAETIVYQAASAVQRARLFDQTEQARRDAERLYTLSAGLNAAQTPGEIIGAIVSSGLAENASGVSLATIEVSAGGKSLRSRQAASWIDPARASTAGSISGLRSHLLRANFARVWRSRPDEPILIADIAADDRADEPLRALCEAAGVAAAASLLLRVRDRWVGMVSFFWPEPRPFSDHDRRLFRSMATQLAVALSNQQLFDQARARSRQLESVSRVEADLSLATTEDEILRALAAGPPWSDPPDLELIYLSTRASDGALLAETVSRQQSDGSDLPVTGGGQLLRALPLSALWLDKPRELLVIEDVQSDSRLDETMRAQVRREGRGALVVMPLRRGGQWQGSVIISWPRAHKLTADEAFVLERLHEPLAATIAGRRAYLAQRAALDQTEALYNVSARLNMAQSYEDVLAVIRQHTELGRAADGLHFAHFDQPWLPDRPPEWVALLAQWRSDGEVAPATRFRVDDYPVVRLLRADRPTVFADIANDPRLDRAARIALQEPAGSGSAVFAPLVVGGQWIGYVSLFYRRGPRTFSEEEIERLAGLIGQVSVAAQTIILLERTQAALADQARLSGQLRAVSDVSVTAAATLDVDRLLSAAADLTKQNFNLYHAHIYLLDEDRTTLALRAGAGDIGRRMLREGRQIPIDASSIVARAAREREVVLVADTRRSPDFLPHPLLPDTRSEMAVPLIIGDRLLGVLDVQSDQVGRFQPDDVQVYKILAAQLAVATQNATYFSEQLEMAEKLREVDRLKTDFLARMSHELRTPLNSIIGFADVLLMGLDGDLTDRMVEDLQLIRSSGYHLRDIIGDILDMSRIEAGRLELTYETFDIRRVVAELMATAAPLAEQKGLSLRLDIADEVGLMEADRTRLRQVLWNIIGNAIKFTDRGEISVSVRRDNGAVLFGVADTGIGIPPENLPRIFDHFSQVDPGHRESVSGTGLGLSISKSLVELHGGRIWVSSEPGEGSCFQFTIPSPAGRGGDE